MHYLMSPLHYWITEFYLTSFSFWSIYCKHGHPWHLSNYTSIHYYLLYVSLHDHIHLFVMDSYILRFSPILLKTFSFVTLLVHLIFIMCLYYHTSNDLRRLFCSSAPRVQVLQPYKATLLEAFSILVYSWPFVIFQFLNCYVNISFKICHQVCLHQLPLLVQYCCLSVFSQYIVPFYKMITNWTKDGHYWAL